MSKYEGLRILIAVTVLAGITAVGVPCAMLGLIAADASRGWTYSVSREGDRNTIHEAIDDVSKLANSAVYDRHRVDSKESFVVTVNVRAK